MSNIIKKWGCLNGVSTMAIVVSIHDGDTLHVHAPVGEAGGVYDVTCRLAGIDSPELKDQERGHKAKHMLEELVAETGGNLFCKFGPKDKYGRITATLFGDMSKPSLNQRMIDTGHAVEYHGGKRAMEFLL